MSEFMTRTIIRKKYLVWYGDDNGAKVVEFRTCDCFLDSILHFKKKYDGFDEKLIKDFFLIKYLQKLILKMMFF